MRSIPAEFQELFDRFAHGPTLVRTAIEGLNASSLNQRPGGESWSVRDIVIHLADTELARAFRFRLIIAEDEPTLVAFDETAWQRRLQYLWRDVEAALVLFQQARYSNAELLSYSGKAAWERRGQHTEDGLVSVRDLVVRGVEHVDAHVDQIQAARKAIGR